MIPCFSQPAFHLGSTVLYAHGILLALGTILASLLFFLRAKSLPNGQRTAIRMILILLPASFLASHLMYSALDDPSALFHFAGISSLGGIIAAVLTFALYVHRSPQRWQWFDATVYPALCGAIVARLGCFLAHDRLGALTSFPLSVNCGDGPRYDLALFEIIFLAICLIALLAADRRDSRRPDGATFSALVLVYGLFRLALGQLADAQPLHQGLNAEQLAALFLIVAAGVIPYQLSRTQSAQRTP